MSTLKSARVILRDCCINVEIGIHDFEQGRRQRFLVDVTVDALLGPFGENINNTLDYDLIRNRILQMADKKYNLQETFCEELLDFIGTLPGVTRATVYTRKPDVYPETREVGLEFTRDYRDSV